jgi:hypothetical protein
MDMTLTIISLVVIHLHRNMRVNSKWRLLPARTLSASHSDFMRVS